MNAHDFDITKSDQNLDIEYIDYPELVWSLLESCWQYRNEGFIGRLNQQIMELKIIQVAEYKMLELLEIKLSTLDKAEVNSRVTKWYHTEKTKMEKMAQRLKYIMSGVKLRK